MAIDLDLSRKVGPLPMGGWIAIVGGAIGFYEYRKNQNTVAPVIDTSATGVDSAVGDGSVGGFSSTMPSDNTTGIAPAPLTNEDWAQLRGNQLIAKGFNPAIVDSALRKYLDGSVGMSAQEFAIITEALAMGLPPMILPAPAFAPPTIPKATIPSPTPIPSKGKPVVIPKPKPVSKPAVRHYTVKPGDTLSGIGKKYGVSWQSIFNANKNKIKNPNVIHVGWILVIPN